MKSPKAPAATAVARASSESKFQVLSREFSENVNVAQKSLSIRASQSGISTKSRRVLAGALDLVALFLVVFFVQTLGVLIDDIDFNTLDVLCGKTCDPDDVTGAVATFIVWLDRDIAVQSGNYFKAALADVGEWAGVTIVGALLFGLILLFIVLFLYASHHYNLQSPNITNIAISFSIYIYARRYGQTPGKMMTGLVIIDENSRALSTSFLRALLLLAPLPVALRLNSLPVLCVFPIHAAMILATEKTLLDYVFKTTVVDVASHDQPLAKAYQDAKLKETREGSYKGGYLYVRACVRMCARACVYSCLWVV